MFPDFAIGDYTCFMLYCFASFELFGKRHMLQVRFHKPFSGLIHRVAPHCVFQQSLHLDDIYNAAFGKPLKLLMVDIGSVHGDSRLEMGVMVVESMI